MLSRQDFKMYGFRIISLLLAICSFAYAQTPNKQVVNGEDAAECAFPYMVLIETFFADKTSWCGATLLDNNHVLTAAHCLTGNLLRITAHLGSVEKRRPKVSIKVKKWHPHPQYLRAGGTILNDIAVLTLSEPVKFTRCIKPLPLPNSSDTFSGVCTVVGWGKLSENGGYPEKLQTAKMNIIPFDRCNRRYYNTKAEQHICVGNGQRNGNNICNGDSGGPLICQGRGGKFLAGVASYGYNCDISFSIFAKVTTFVEYINTIRSFKDE